MQFEQSKFTGGIAEGSKVGYEGSFQDGLALDYMSDPDKLQVAKRLVKESKQIVTDLPVWHAEHEGEDLFYGNTGKIYNRTAGGIYSVLKTVTDSNGNGFAIFNDELWYTSDEAIGKATDPVGSPTYFDDYFKSLTSNRELAMASSGAQVYTTPVAIAETAANLKSWVAVNSVITGVLMYVVAKGTGNVTVTLHDTGNVVIAAKTISTSTLTAAKWTFWQFDSAAQLTVGNTYHFHVTSTVADTTVQTSTAADLSTVLGIVTKNYNELDVDQSNPASAIAFNLVSVGTTLSEVSTSYVSFTAEYESLAAVSFWLEANSGAYTVVVHDANNVTIGSFVGAAGATFALSRFEFTNPLSLDVGSTYHVHIYKSSGAATNIMAEGTTISTAIFYTHFQVLQDVEWHMCKVFTNLLCIGNGNYLATIDDSEVFVPEALKFPLGENVRSLETIGDYLAITTTKGSSLSDYGRSRMYLWDGVSDVFNAFLDIDGQVGAMVNDSNKLMFIHGTQAQISYYTGAITKVRKLKYANEDVSLEINPGAVDTYEGVVYFGPTNVTDDAVRSCIYSYGRKDKDYPVSLNTPCTISTGDYTNNVDIGVIKGVASDKFFVGWQNNKKVALFDATTSVITVPSNNNTSIDNLFDDGGSISYLVYPSSGGENNGGRIVDKGQWLIFAGAPSGGAIRVIFSHSFSGTSGTWQTSNFELPIDSWSHVAIVYNNNNVANDPLIYINGTSVAVTENTAPVGTRTTALGNTLYIGNNGANNRTWDGKISDLQLYTSSLNASAAALLSNDVISNSSIVSRYKLDESSGTVAEDSVGGLDGTISTSNITTFHNTTSFYGLDNISNSRKQLYAEYTTLRFDAGNSNLLKRFKSFSLRFANLVAGQTITVLYRFDNKGSFVELGEITQTGDISYYCFSDSIIANNEFFEIEFKFVVENAVYGSDMPDIISYLIEFDQQKQIQMDSR